MPQVPAVGVEVHWTIVVRVVTVERALAAHLSDGATASETASSSSRSRCVMPEVGSLALPLPRLPLPQPLPRRPPADERVQGTFAHPLPPRDEADGGVRSPPRGTSASNIDVLSRAYHCFGVLVWLVCAYGRSLDVSVTSVLSTCSGARRRSEGALRCVVRVVWWYIGSMFPVILSDVKLCITGF